MSTVYLPANACRPTQLFTSIVEQTDDRLQLLRSMLADHQWPCPPPVRGQLLQILVSATGGGCTEESAWMTLAEEIARYLLYRRTGQLETALLEWQRPRREHRSLPGRRVRP